MITYGGERITLTTGAPNIRTIGVALGRIARFCGHTQKHYTVLGHVLTVSQLVPEKYAIYGLMHDAQEALVSDVPTPMKSQVARNREHGLLKRIYIANGLPWPIPEEAQEEVDMADEKALIAEAHVLKHPGAKEQWGDEYDPVAALLTRKHLRSVQKWLDAETAANVFEKAFRSAYAKSGLNLVSLWK
jgi:hypothetical protein